jgi:hypothetical protein
MRPRFERADTGPPDISNISPSWGAAYLPAAGGLRPYSFQMLGKRLRGLLQSKYPAYAEIEHAECTQGEAEPHGRRYENGGARG